MTYKEFIDSKKAVQNLSNYIDHHNDSPGLIYLDSYYIEWNGTAYYTLVGVDEMSCTQLEPVEKFLWDSFVEDEVNSTQRSTKMTSAVYITNHEDDTLLKVIFVPNEDDQEVIEEVADMERLTITQEHYDESYVLAVTQQNKIVAITNTYLDTYITLYNEECNRDEPIIR